MCACVEGVCGMYEESGCISLSARAGKLMKFSLSSCSTSNSKLLVYSPCNNPELIYKVVLQLHLVSQTTENSAHSSPVMFYHS